MLPIPIPLKIISYFTSSDIVAPSIAMQFLLLLIVITCLLIKGHRLDSFKFHRVKIVYPHEIKSTIIKHNESIIIMHDYFKLTAIFFYAGLSLFKTIITSYLSRFQHISYVLQKRQKRHYVSLTKN